MAEQGGMKIVAIVCSDGYMLVTPQTTDPAELEFATSAGVPLIRQYIEDGSVLYRVKRRVSRGQMKKVMDRVEGRIKII